MCVSQIAVPSFLSSGVQTGSVATISQQIATDDRFRDFLASYTEKKLKAPAPVPQPEKTTASEQRPSSDSLVKKTAVAERLPSSKDQGAHTSSVNAQSQVKVATTTVSGKSTASHFPLSSSAGHEELSSGSSIGDKAEQMPASQLQEASQEPEENPLSSKKNSPSASTISGDMKTSVFGNSADTGSTVSVPVEEAGFSNLSKTDIEPSYDENKELSSINVSDKISKENNSGSSFVVFDDTLNNLNYSIFDSRKETEEFKTTDFDDNLNQSNGAEDKGVHDLKDARALDESAARSDGQIELKHQITDADAKTRLELDLGSQGRLHIEVAQSGSGERHIRIDADNHHVLESIKDDSNTLLSSLSQMQQILPVQQAQSVPPYDLQFGLIGSNVAGGGNGDAQQGSSKNSGGDRPHTGEGFSSDDGASPIRSSRSMMRGAIDLTV